MNEFLLSDESINSYGMIIKTSGIDMERFKSNPVMFVNHDRGKGVAGRWENLRIQNGGLYGTPIFDDIHEPGKTAREQVENGFMKGASIGIKNLEIKSVAGLDAVVKCELLEVSVCDIPSNKNTIQLYYEDKGVDMNTYKQLSLNNKTMNQEQDYQLVLQALSLPKDATLKDILSSVNILVKLHGKSAKDQLCLAVEDGFVAKEESDDLFNLCNGDPSKLEQYLQKKRCDYELQVEQEYQEILNKTCLKFEPHLYLSGALKNFALKDFKTFKSMLLNGFQVPAIVFGNDNSDDSYSGLRTLDDYRKFAPQQLKDNPNLYKRLIEKEASAENKNNSHNKKYNY